MPPSNHRTVILEPQVVHGAPSFFVLPKIKLGRVGQVEDLMGAIVFLASDASALMTGTSMIIDGGWTAD